MTYDIETLVPSNRGFPTYTAQILYATVYCSCRYTSSHTTIATDGCGNIHRSSTDLMDAMLCDVMAHAPVWLVGYNCYTFNNTCLVFYSRDIMGHAVFKKLTLNTNR